MTDTPYTEQIAQLTLTLVLPLSCELQLAIQTWTEVRAKEREIRERLTAAIHTNFSEPSANLSGEIAALTKEVEAAHKRSAEANVRPPGCEKKVRGKIRLHANPRNRACRANATPDAS
jgi:hypothetical protein